MFPIEYDIIVSRMADLYNKIFAIFVKKGGYDANKVAPVVHLTVIIVKTMVMVI